MHKHDCRICTITLALENRRRCPVKELISACAVWRAGKADSPQKKGEPFFLSGRSLFAPFSDCWPEGLGNLAFDHDGNRSSVGTPEKKKVVLRRAVAAGKWHLELRHSDDGPEVS